MKDIQKIGEDLKRALKSHDHDLVRTLRLLKTALRNKEVELNASLGDKEHLQVVNTLIKQRRESIEQFTKCGRLDLADSEEKEMAILQDYLPPALSEDELAGIIQQVIEESGALGPKEMGKVMKLVMEKVTGRADGKHVSSLVAKLLQLKKS